MMRFIILGVAIGGLSGCQTPKLATPAEPAVRTIIVLPPKELLSKCIAAPLPNKKEYFNADPDARAALMLDYSDRNLKSIGQCNRDWERLKSWKLQTKNKYRFDPNVTILE